MSRADPTDKKVRGRENEKEKNVQVYRILYHVVTSHGP